MSDRTSWWCVGAVAESDRVHSLIVKALIVMIVFPVLVVTLMQPWKLVLYLVLWLVPATKLSGQLAGGAMLVGLVFVVGGALWLCRLIWPKRAANHHA